MLNTLTFKFDIPDSLLPEEDIVTLDWGYLTGDINNQTDLVNLINKKVTDSSAVIYNKIKDISTDINNINGRVDTLNDRLTQKVNSTDFENYQLSVYTKEEVYTKTETDSQINAAKPDLEPYAKKTDIPEMPDLSPYAKKTDIPNTSQFVTNTSVNANYSKIGHTHPEYLTEHQSLANYSKIGHTHPEYLTEHQSLDDYATKEFVESYVPEIDTTSLDSSISDISTRLNTLTSNFNTLVGNEESVNGTINTFKEMESFLQDISDASTLTGLMETEHKKLEDKIDNIKVPTQTSELENNSGFITIDDVVLPDLSVYATNSSVEDNYAKKDHTHSQYLTEHQSLEGLKDVYAPIEHTHNQYALKEDVLELRLFKFPNATIFGTPIINNGQVYNFSANNYLQFPFIVSLSKYGFWIDMCFTTNGIGLIEQLNIFDSKFGLAFAIKDKHFIIAYGTNGTSWANQFTGTYTVQNNTTYYVKIEWYGMDSADLNVLYSLDNKNWDLDISEYMPQPPYPTQVIIGKSLDNKYPFTGTINLNYCSLTMPDGNVWNGMDDAGLGTRLAVDMSNIDAAGEQKIKDIIGPIPEAQPAQDLTNYLDKTFTGTNIIKGKFQVGTYDTNVNNAYLHIRNVGSTNITGYNVNGACFAVNADGTASFQHKTYADNGTGAKNSAVLRFSNKGIQFAVNSGTGASPSEDMYKELATQDYVDTQIGDIKTVLESI